MSAEAGPRRQPPCRSTLPRAPLRCRRERRSARPSECSRGTRRNRPRPSTARRPGNGVAGATTSFPARSRLGRRGPRGQREGAEHEVACREERIEPVSLRRRRAKENPDCRPHQPRQQHKQNCVRHCLCSPGGSLAMALPSTVRNAVCSMLKSGCADEPRTWMTLSVILMWDAVGRSGLIGRN